MRAGAFCPPQSQGLAFFKRMAKIGYKLFERARTGRIATDQNQIDRIEVDFTRYTCKCSAKSAPRTITYDCITDFLGNRISNAGWCFLVGLQNLKNETGCGDLAPTARNAEKLRSFPEFGRQPRQVGSGRELLAALGATVVDDATATDGFHAGTEAVTTLADELGRLVSTLHGVIPQGNE